MTRLLVVDAFAAGPFTGNPAAVCLLERERADAWLAAVAAEMNLSETAFLLPRGDAWGLRWFTPTTEVELCGHGTLASAHALWELGLADAGAPLAFETLSGTLSAARRGDRVEIDLPATRVEPAPEPEGLRAALGGAVPVAVGRSRFDLVVELADAAAVRGLAPDPAGLAAIDARGVCVAALGDGEHDFVSRFFAPSCGVVEDPVTGSAHCALGPWFGARLGRDRLRAWQASRRGGEVEVTLDGDRVRLAGRAVTTLRGELLA